MGSPCAQEDSQVTIRAVTRDDAPLIRELVQGLSSTSRYLRFFSGMRELPQELLERITRPESGRAATLLAVCLTRGREVAVGMAQFAATEEPRHCEFAVVVSDRAQGHGVGTQLIRRIACAARAAGFERIGGEVLAQNRRMLEILQAMGFRLRVMADYATVLSASIPAAEMRWDCAEAGIR